MTRRPYKNSTSTCAPTSANGRTTKRSPTTTGPGSRPPEASSATTSPPPASAGGGDVNYWQIIDQKGRAEHDCDYCGARKGERCVTSSGNAYPHIHASREDKVMASLKDEKDADFKAPVSMRLSGSLLDRLEKYRLGRSWPVSRTDVMTAALTEYLDRHE